MENVSSSHHVIFYLLFSSILSFHFISFHLLSSSLFFSNEFSFILYNLPSTSLISSPLLSSLLMTRFNSLLYSPSARSSVRDPEGDMATFIEEVVPSFWILPVIELN